MNNKSKRLFIEKAAPLVVAAAYIVPQLSPAPPASLNADPANFLLTGMTAALSQAALLFCIIGLSRGFRERRLVKGLRTDLLEAIFIAAAVLALGVLCSRVFPGRVATTPEHMAFLPALGFSLAVGVNEELFYRVYLQDELLKRGAPAWGAVSASVLLFTAGHAGQGIPGMVSAALLGLSWSMARQLGASFRSLALSHAAYDLIVLLS